MFNITNECQISTKRQNILHITIIQAINDELLSDLEKTLM